MDPEEIRRQALSQAIQENPDLATSSSPEDVARLQELVDEKVREIQLREEVAELRRREFAEEARRQGQEAQRAREEQRRIEDEKRRLAREQQQAAERARQAEEKRAREAELGEMGPVRRLYATHRLPAIFGTLLVIGLVVVGGVWGVRTVLDNRERDELYAKLQANNSAVTTPEPSASSSPSPSAKSSQNEAFSSAQIDQLAAACDLDQASPDMPREVWEAWLECDDLAVKEAAFLKVLPRVASTETLLELARYTKNSDAAIRISNAPQATVETHEVLLDRWGIEVVPASYRVVYKQGCSYGVPPDTYLSETSWADGTGQVLQFEERKCRVAAFPIDIRDGSREDAQWLQPSPNRILIMQGTQTLFEYRLSGGNLELAGDRWWEPFSSDMIKPPEVLTRS